MVAAVMTLYEPGKGVNTLFGYMPRLGGNLRLCDTNAPRGFLGELCNVRYGSSMYEIRASGVGLNLKRQI
jgi:hypothetical protein